MSEEAKTEKKKMSKTKKIVLIVVVCVLVAVIAAVAIPSALVLFKESDFEYTKVDGGYEVSFHLATMNNQTDPIDLKIPAEHEGEPVVGIAAKGFLSLASRLRSVGIPASVTYIGDEAFKGCVYLESIEIASGSALKTVGKRAFYECSMLGGIPLPDSVESIGQSAFSSCIKMISFKIPSGVKVIESYTFSWSGVRSVSGSGITEIKEGAFANSAIENLNDLSLVKGATVDATAFKDCSKLKGLSDWLDQWK